MFKLLETLSRLSISLKATGSELEIYDPENSITEELLDQIKINKQEILRLLGGVATRPAYTPIPSAELKDCYVLSAAQRRMFFLSIMYPGTVTYNISQAIKITGHIDVVRLENALVNLVQRHESLRTSFAMLNDEPYQFISAYFKPEIKRYSARDSNETRQLAQDFIRPFKLDQLPLMRIGLIEQTGEATVIVVDMHHIISDGVSGNVLVRDFISFYEGVDLPPLTLQYKDYAVWQQSPAELLRKEEQKKYWLNEFAGEIPSLELPLDYPRTAVWDERGQEHLFIFNKELTDGLKNIAAAQGASLFMVTLSLYNILLSKISNQQDIVVGTVTAGRNHPDIEDIIGMFVNTLVLRNRPEGGKSYKDFLNEVKNTFLRSLQNQEYQYEDLLDALQVPRDTGRNPLFDVLISYHRQSDEKGDIHPVKAEPFQLQTSVAKFDLTLNVAEEGDLLVLVFDYRSCLFKKETIERFAGYLQRIAEMVVFDSNCLLLEIDIMDEAEITGLLDGFANTGVSYPKEKTVISLFEEQVIRTPDAVAVKMGHNSLTYRELDVQAEQLGIRLQQKGVKPDSIVGLMLEKNTSIITGMLGILKAGGAYMPIDVDYPLERKQYMLDNSGAAHLLTTTEYVPGGFYKGEVILFDLPPEEQNSTGTLSGTKALAGNLCYVIYTSGTTGNPKGVMIENRNVVRLLFNSEFQFDFDAKDVWTMFHSHCFDFSVWEMYGALLYGGKLIIVPRETARDTAAFLHLLYEEKVTVLNQTPSAFYSLMQEEMLQEKHGLWLRYIIFGGEALSPGKLQPWNKQYPGVKFINMYGITETTVHVTFREITKEDIESNISNIGKPIPTLTVYLLDQYKKLVPAGTAGELYVGGAGVARGYLNNPSLTKLKFIPNPYNQRERLYRSGDLARMLPTGDMEYLGRIDDQVKIRGFRIELSEIEHHLLKHPQIKEVAVVLKAREGDKFIAAYYVADELIEGSLLKKYLQRNLPEHMVPAFFTRLDKIPITYNGKLDKKSLPEPDIFAGTEIEMPVTLTESKLADIWAEVLKLPLETISINRSFFELGGHSLRAVTLRNKISKVFDVDISVQQIFQHQDIRSQAMIIGETNKTEFQPIPLAGNKDYYVLSSAQRRMYLLDAMSDGQTTYNIPLVFRIQGSLNHLQLEYAYNQLLQHHESLRTSFVLFNDEPQQVIRPHYYQHLEVYTANEETEADRLLREFVRPFDLSRDPLLRMGIIAIDEDDHILMADMHHIISDGISTDIIRKDMLALYAGHELPSAVLQYKDFAEWQQSLPEQKRITEHRSFWLKEFSQEVVPLELPADHARPQVRKDEGDVYSFFVEADLYAALKKIADDQGASFFMVFLSLYNIFLSKICNQQDIIVGTPTSGRQHPDLDSMIGMFVNTLVLRNDVKGDQSFPEFLQTVKSKFLLALQHQEYQYEDLVDALQLPRDTSRNPLFDTMLSFHNSEELTAQVPGLDISAYPFVLTVSKFDLSLDVNLRKDAIQLSFEYSTALFESSTIRSFADNLLTIIRHITSEPAVMIGEIEFLSQEEKANLLGPLAGETVDYKVNSSLPELLRLAAVSHANNPALIFGDNIVTYSVLQEKSNQWAHFLRNNFNIVRDDRIGICAARSPELIFALLGIIKSGGAYVFIDPENPVERINWIINDSGIRVLLCDTIMPALDDRITVIGFGNPQVQVSSLSDLPDEINDNQLAYVIYTSGSTGTPKGVLIEHKSLKDYVITFSRYFQVTGGDKVIHQSSLSFDTSVEELFPALINGAAVIIVKQGARDIDDLADQIYSNSATILSTTPLILGELNKYPEKLKRLRLIISGGEQLKTSCISNMTDIPIYNTYGPSESTVCASYHRLRSIADTQTIGKPIANRKIYILNKDRQLVSPRTTGEIAIAGLGLARGYLNFPEIQSSKFIPDPFRPGERLYLTGDNASRDKDGNILFKGRKDEQLKIRGIRIEPGEIESHLVQFSGITAAVADVVVVQNNQIVVAYYTGSENTDISALRNFLAERLPRHLIPAQFIWVLEFPYTTQGKLNKKALPAPYESASVAYEGPANETEHQLTRIWADLLKLSPGEISVNSDFFELGGHSLNATTLSNRINRIFNKPVISLTVIFRNPTIRLLSERIREQETAIWQTGLTLVSLNYAGAGKANLFFIHDGGGDIQAYRQLSGLISKYNSWGIRSETLLYTEPLNIEIKELAAIYLKHIKVMQPNGPYTLAGWSTGGTIAYEMIRQLEQAGESGAKLVMIDTEIVTANNTNLTELFPDFEAESEKKLFLQLTDTFVPEIQEAVSVKEVWKQILVFIQRENMMPDILAVQFPQALLQLIPNFEKLDSKTFIRIANTVRTLGKASDKYVFTTPLNTQVVYFAARIRLATQEAIAGLSVQPVMYLPLEGDHFSIMNSEETKFIAEQISAHNLASHI